MEKQKFDFVPGMSGGQHLSGAPLTTEAAEVGAPGLLRNAVDEAITKIRPMSTPLDQISRLGHVRNVDSMSVDYYAVDSRKGSAQVSEMAVVPDTDDEAGNTTFEVTVDEPTVFEVSESFCYRTRMGDMQTGYVIAKTAEGKLQVVASKTEFTTGVKELLRMGRAATQLDVQSPQFNALPRKQTNFCQIFKMQVEQSQVMKLSHKEIGWDFSDQQEAAVYDMRLGMEKQFLFGRKMKIYDYVKQESVLLTQGIWHQAGSEITIDSNDFDARSLVDMMRSAFTENSGSRRKVLVAGSGLISLLNKLDAQRVIGASDKVTVWGIDFSEICSKFGRLLVIFSEVFDIMGMQNSGLIVDPEYIQKHVFIPLQAETIDLRGSGQRNTEAIVLTEASCLTLRYPEAHCRVNCI